MQVQTPQSSTPVMIEAGREPHAPGPSSSTRSAPSWSGRGPDHRRARVQLVGTATACTLDILLVNPTLNDLFGRHPDRHPLRRGGAPPRHLEVRARAQGAAHFDVLVEIQQRDRVAVHMPVDETSTRRFAASTSHLRSGCARRGADHQPDRDTGDTQPVRAPALRRWGTPGLASGSTVAAASTSEQ